MRTKQLRYFVCCHFQAQGKGGFTSREVVTELPITSMAMLSEIAQGISAQMSEELKASVGVSVISWQRFEEPSVVLAGVGNGGFAKVS